MTIHKFIFDAILQSQKTKRSYGTCIMEELRLVRAGLWHKADGAGLTVFGMSGPAENPERWDKFFEYIERNWYGVPS